MERLILARHAESEWNVRGVLNGDVTQPGALSPAGRAQAQRLGEAFAGETIDLCVTSPFQRTRETAEIALAGRHVPRLVVPELAEHPAGDYEGRPLDEYIVWAHAHDSDAPVPGTSETRRELARRVARGYRIVLERPEPSVFAVVHKLTICYLLGGATRELPELGYATATTLGRAEVEAGVERLETWCAAPTW
jgi:broad specificity phosphatase PhoE